MKRLILVVLATVIMAGQAWAIDCKQLTAKYIKAAQGDDYKNLLGMSAFYQGNASAIKQNSPKYRADSELNSLSESEKKRTVKWMFTPASKWKILETKNMQLDKKTNICTVYIQMDYPNYEDAPNTVKATFSGQGKKLKSSVVAIAFDNKTGYVFGDPSTDDSVTEYWDAPLRVSELTYEIGKYLNLYFKIDGGVPELSGGKGPYTNKIFINDLPMNVFFEKSSEEYSMKELGGGSWLEISTLGYFAWPSNTELPLKLKLEVTDSSTPPKIAFKEILIDEGKIKKERVKAIETLDEPAPTLERKAKRSRPVRREITPE